MTKERAPAFQFYPADFLADEHVSIMTATEVGAYILLMCYCWREGSIPADIKSLSRLCRMDEGSFDEISTTVQRPFNAHPTEAQRLVHPRLERERSKQLQRRKQASEAGLKSAEQRRKTSKPSQKSTNYNGRSTTVQRPFNAHPTLLSSSSTSTTKTGLEAGGSKSVEKTLKSVFEDLHEHHLKSPKTIIEWYRWQLQQPSPVLPENSPDAAIRCLMAAKRALTVPLDKITASRIGLFCGIVAGKKWRVCAEHEHEARRQYADFARGSVKQTMADQIVNNLADAMSLEKTE